MSFCGLSYSLATYAESVSGEYESDSVHLNAPVWPWSVAGWSFAAAFLLFFLIAWLNA